MKNDLIGTKDLKHHTDKLIEAQEKLIKSQQVVIESGKKIEKLLEEQVELHKSIIQIQMAQIETLQNRF